MCVESSGYRFRTVYGSMLGFSSFSFFVFNANFVFGNSPSKHTHTQYVHNLLVRSKYTLTKTNGNRLRNSGLLLGLIHKINYPYKQ